MREHIAKYIGIRGGMEVLTRTEKKTLGSLAEAASPRKNKTFEDRAMEALEYAFMEVKRHPEFDRFSGHKPEIEVEKRNRSKVVAMDVQFAKYGHDIFVVRPEDDDGDYDWPDFVGGRIIAAILEKAAKKAGMTKDVDIYISPSEKGWLDMGYERKIDPAERKRTVEFERSKKKLLRAAREFVKILGKHPEKVKLARTPKENSKDVPYYGGWLHSVEVSAIVTKKNPSGDLNVYAERGKGRFAEELEEALRKAGIVGKNVSYNQDVGLDGKAVFQFLLKK